MQLTTWSAVEMVSVSRWTIVNVEKDTRELSVQSLFASALMVLTLNHALLTDHALNQISAYVKKDIQT